MLQNKLLSSVLLEGVAVVATVKKIQKILFDAIWCKDNKTFYDRNLRIFVVS